MDHMRSLFQESYRIHSVKHAVCCLVFKTKQINVVLLQSTTMIDECYKLLNLCVELLQTTQMTIELLQTTQMTVKMLQTTQITVELLQITHSTHLTVTKYINYSRSATNHTNYF